jgi:hypothetical protein
LNKDSVGINEIETKYCMNYTIIKGDFNGENKECHFRHIGILNFYRIEAGAYHETKKLLLLK